MKLELRLCKKCLHKTIQVECEVHEQAQRDTLHGTLVWYCPNCGYNWKVVKRSEDVEVKAL